MASVASIEISSPRTPLERAFEIIPGLTSWGFLILIILLSFVRPTAAAYMIISFDLLWLAKSFGMSRRMIQGYGRLHRYERFKWQQWLEALKDYDSALAKARSLKKSREGQWFERTLSYYHQSRDQILNPDDILNAVIIATYKETLDTLVPTVETLLKSNYNLKQLVVYIAYEERGGKLAHQNANYLVRKFGSKFHHMEAVMHPADIPGEIIGKGGNITHAGRQLEKWVDRHGINPDNVIVTTLDSDNRPHPNYFAYLTFVYCLLPDRRFKSFQPVPMFYNNIWDAPAPMRLIAVGNSFWMIIQSMRPHLLRNFAAHSQGLAALIDTNFWSVRTIVEDGHQYWRTYFRYDGRHDAIPMFVPVYQDAVLADTYWRTLKAQFIQVRRWAWGVSDISYVVSKSLKNHKIHFSDKLIKFFRLFEGHFSWAVAPIILSFAGWLPLFIGRESENSIVAHQLPIIASRIQTIAAFGIVISILLTLMSLPPRPAHHKRRRHIGMALQWVLIPVTGIFFGSFAAFTAQTRLMLGRYLTTFDFTEKAVHRAVRRAKSSPDIE